MAADNPIDPIHQFEISKIADIQLGGIDISFTNSSLFMVFALAATMVLFVIHQTEIQLLDQHGDLKISG